MEDLDPDFYKNLKWLLSVNLDSDFSGEYFFVYQEEEFGTLVNKDLIENGRNIPVTEANKMEYIKVLCHHKMTKNIRA